MSSQFEIVKREDGISAIVENKTLFLPNAELLNIGCRNCVWKLHAQCPHELKDDEQNAFGICNELVNFVLSLAEKEDSVSALWEKFHIYKARLQEAEDYKDFLRLEKEIKEREKNIFDENDIKAVNKLRMDKTAAKMWWQRLNEQVVKSLQKVVDREATKTIKMDITHTDRLSISDIQRLMRIEPKKVVEGEFEESDG